MLPAPPVPEDDPTARAPNRTPREFAWRWGRFTLPPAWEVFSFTKRAEAGNVKFQTRAGLQAVYAWRKVPGRPDLARIMNEVHRRALADRAKNDPPAAAAADAFHRLTTQRAGAFTLGFHRDGEPAQALAYLPDAEMLLEWLFPVDRRDAREAIWKPLLKSFRPNDGTVRRWAIFGIGLNLPETFGLSDVAAYPANVVLQFDGPGKLFVNVRRWGLPDHLLAGRTVGEYYRGVLKSLRNRVVMVEPAKLDAPGRRAPFDAAIADYERQGEVAMDKLVGRLWTGQGVCWHDPDVKRLYAFEQFGPAKAERLRLADVFFAKNP